MYEVSEDARLDTEFRRSVKGTSQFGDALVLNGVKLSQLQLMALPVGTEVMMGFTYLNLSNSVGNTDFYRLSPVAVSRDGAEIRLFTAKDVITLEYNDRILLTYTPSNPGLIPGVEGAGEYIRNTAIGRIIDNDSKNHCTTASVSYSGFLCSVG